MKIVLQPELLRWARLRAGLNEDELAKKMHVKPEKICHWEEDGGLTFKQAEKLAEKTYTPFGYLFLDEPPEEKLPVSDFRTIPGEEKGKPSPELLDTLYDAMEKQSWYRDYLMPVCSGRE